MNSDRILVIGSFNADMVTTSPKLPAPGETILAKDFTLLPGGKGANQAIATKRAGGNIDYMGCFGKDRFAEIALNAMEQDKINTDLCVQTDQYPSGVAFVLVDANSGENMIVVAPGANLFLSSEHLDKIDFGDYGVVLCQLENRADTVEYALKKAKASGCVTILNPAPAQKLSASMLNVCDIITPNEHELKTLVGLNDSCTMEEAVKQVLSMGVKHIIVTCGDKGAIDFSADETKKYPAIKVTAVDTVGAGDCFNGFLAAALSQGEPLDKAITYAVCGASLSVTCKGAQPSMPTRQMILQKLQG